MRTPCGADSRKRHDLVDPTIHLNILVGVDLCFLNILLLRSRQVRANTNVKCGLS